MKSPIYFSDLLGARIDLSQVIEISELVIADFVLDRFEPHAYFHYRYADHVEKIDALLPFKRGVVRVNDYSHLSRFEVEEFRKVFHAANKIAVPPDQEELYLDCTEIHSPKLIEIKNENGQSKGRVRIQAGYDALISSWIKWKEIEPEIYAIVRKHLS